MYLQQIRLHAGCNLCGADSETHTGLRTTTWRQGPKENLLAGGCQPEGVLVELNHEAIQRLLYTCGRTIHVSISQPTSVSIRGIIKAERIENVAGKEALPGFHYALASCTQVHRLP